MKTKLKKPIIISGSVILFILIALSTYGVYSFFSNYGLQSPLLFRSPIYTLKQEAYISPLASFKKQSVVFNVGEIADKIYTLESSNGRNDSCKNLGKFNGYGYRQNTFEWICYDSHEEVRQLVITWLTKHIKDGDIESALCMYNQGKTENECTYSINYRSL